MALVSAHALLLPFPAQGHINPMMQLAKILVNSKRILVTFVNTDFTHQRMNPVSTDYIKFKSFADGLPPDHVRTLKLPELCDSLQKHAPFHVENIVEKLSHSINPVTIIVADGVLSFTQHIADKFGVPRVAFWTTSACGFSAYYYMPLLIDHAYIPLKEDAEKYMNEVIPCIPEMPTLRVKDLPSFLTVTDASDYMFQYLMREAQNTQQASLVLLNTFEDLEGPVLSDLNARFSEKVLSIGTLFGYSSAAVDDDVIAGSSSTIWKEEMSCLEWLDKQEESSVIYVCFGSITVVSNEELVEFAWGLEASNRPFLWAIRPDLVQGKSPVLPAEFVERTKERGFFVSWAAQSKVLSHSAVGGFLTHNGWNSTIESICSGVPMICWPFFAEQPTNRRFVTHVWKVGFEMKEIVRRRDVETLVNKLMNDHKPIPIAAELKKLKEAAIASVQVGGASYNHLQNLLHQILLPQYIES